MTYFPLKKHGGGEKDQGILPLKCPDSHCGIYGMIGQIAECLEMHKGLVEMKLVGNKNYEFVNGQIC